MTTAHDEGFEEARFAVIDALLAEVFAGSVRGGGGAAVVQAFAAGAGAAAAAQLAAAERALGVSRSRAAARRSWLVAALLLLGSGVLVAVAWLQARTPDKTAQDPDRADADVVPVRDLAHLRELLPKVARAELEVLMLSDPDLPAADIAGAPVRATDEWTRGFVAALAGDARVETPAGWDWQNRLTLVLEGGQRIVMAVFTYDHGPRLRLGLRGIHGDLSIGGAGAAAVRDLLATATQVARMANGVVVRAADLAGSEAFPANLEELRVLGLAEADFQHLQRFTNLKRLFVSGMKRPLGDTALRHIADNANIEELSLADNELAGDALRHLARLPRLRRLDLRNVRSLTDEGLLRAVESGATDVLLGHSGAGIGPAGWRALMAAKELRVLDVSKWSLDDGRLADLARRTDLQELMLDDCGLGDAQLTVLAAAKAPLRVLSLRYNKPTAKGFEALLALKTLRKLDIRGIHGLDLEAMSIAAFMRPDVEWVR